MPRIHEIIAEVPGYHAPGGGGVALFQPAASPAQADVGTAEQISRIGEALSGHFNKLRDAELAVEGERLSSSAAVEAAVAESDLKNPERGEVNPTTFVQDYQKKLTEIYSKYLGQITDPRVSNVFQRKFETMAKERLIQAYRDQVGLRVDRVKAGALDEFNQIKVGASEAETDSFAAYLVGELRARRSFYTGKGVFHAADAEADQIKDENTIWYARANRLVTRQPMVYLEGEKTGNLPEYFSKLTTEQKTALQEKSIRSLEHIYNFSEKLRDDADREAARPLLQKMYTGMDQADAIKAGRFNPKLEEHLLEKNRTIQESKDSKPETAADEMVTEGILTGKITSYPQIDAHKEKLGRTGTIAAYKLLDEKIRLSDTKRTQDAQKAADFIEHTLRTEGAFEKLNALTNTTRAAALRIFWQRIHSEDPADKGKTPWEIVDEIMPEFVRVISDRLFFGAEGIEPALKYKTQADLSEAVKAGKLSPQAAQGQLYLLNRYEELRAREKSATEAAAAAKTETSGKPKRKLVR